MNRPRRRSADPPAGGKRGRKPWSFWTGDARFRLTLGCDLIDIFEAPEYSAFRATVAIFGGRDIKLFRSGGWLNSERDADGNSRIRDAADALVRRRRIFLAEAKPHELDWLWASAGSLHSLIVNTITRNAAGRADALARLEKIDPGWPAVVAKLVAAICDAPDRLNVARLDQDRLPRRAGSALFLKWAAGENFLARISSDRPEAVEVQEVCGNGRRATVAVARPAPARGRKNAPCRRQKAGPGRGRP